MRRALRETAQQISDSLMRELAEHQSSKAGGTDGDLLVNQLAEEVVRRMTETGSNGRGSMRDLDKRLRKLETTLTILAGGAHEDEEDEDEVEGAGSSFPNLKYAKPKYKDVQSVLRYIESDAQNGGLKLVIMNFND